MTILLQSITTLLVGYLAYRATVRAKRMETRRGEADLAHREAEAIWKQASTWREEQGRIISALQTRVTSLEHDKDRLLAQAGEQTAMLDTMQRAIDKQAGIIDEQTRVIAELREQVCGKPACAERIPGNGTSGPPEVPAALKGRARA